jgi:two-component system, sensor histidine kinase LadS
VRRLRHNKLEQYFYLVALFTFFPKCVISQSVRPDSVLTINEPKDFFPLNLASFLLKDKQGTLSLENALKSRNFRPILQEMYNFDQDQNIKVYWFRCTIDNRTKSTLRELLCLHRSLDSLESFILYPDNSLHFSKSNAIELTRRRPVFISQQIIVPFELQPGITKIYVKVFNSSIRSHEIGSLIASLADEKSFLNYYLETRMYHGGVLGMLLLLLVLYLFVFLVFRDSAYFVFLINLFFTILYLVLRKNYQFEFDFLAPAFELLIESHDVIGVLISLTGIWFVKIFLNLRQNDLRINYLMNIMISVLAIAAVVAIVFHQVYWLNAVSIYGGLLSSLVITLSSVRSYFRGNKLSLYIFFGFLILTFVPIVYIIPIPNYLHYKNEESDYHYLGEIVRCIVFSIGIADRFYSLKKQVNQKEIEKAEQALLHEKRNHQEKERISRDLHDNIGSELAILTLELNLLAKEYPQNEKLGVILSSSLFIGSQLRDTVWAIEKRSITIEDLEIRINNLLMKLRKNISTIEFRLEKSVSDALLKLTPSQGINLFRIIQEAINNAVKHSHSNLIRILICDDLTAGTFCITVSDNGKGIRGFSPHFAVDGHYGLRNMKKRAQEIGCHFAIESCDELGTTIKVALPVAVNAKPV